MQDSHVNKSVTDEAGDANRPSMSWKVIVMVNAVLGLLLWFGYCTDYSWTGTLPNFGFILMAGIISIASVLRKTKGRTSINRRFYILACFPSLVGGGIAIILMVIMIIPPFTLGFLFGISEILNEKHIQRSVSPDNTRNADVYFRGVGAYSGGNGRISIRVKHRAVPFVEREVYYLGRSYADEATTEYVKWEDTNTLLIVGEPSETKGVDREVKVGIVKFKSPPIFVIPINIATLLFQSIKQ